MNFLVKYVVTSLVVNAASKGAVRLVEAGLAKTDPAKHEAYVDYFVEIAEARLEAFIKRNADVAVANSPERTAEEEAAYQEYKDTLADIVTKARDLISGGNSA